MTEKNQPPASPAIGGGKPRSTTSYILLGGAFIVVLLIAVVAMLLITGGDVSETRAPTSLSEAATEGKALFIASNCNSCHPSEGRAGGIGPRLSTTNVSDDSIRNAVRKGRGAMPAYSKLSDDQLNTLVAYIRALKPA